jgi:hypothetical protein
LINVVLAVAWFVSGWWGVWWLCDWTDRGTMIGVACGSLRLYADRGVTVDAPWPGTIRTVRISDTQIEPLWWFRPRLRTGAPFNLSVPMWIPGSATLLAALALFRLDRRGLPNSCPHCRYDLSATPPSAPCPECGSVATHRNKGDAAAPHQG